MSANRFQGRKRYSCTNGICDYSTGKGSSSIRFKKTEKAVKRIVSKALLSKGEPKFLQQALAVSIGNQSGAATPSYALCPNNQISQGVTNSSRIGFKINWTNIQLDLMLQTGNLAAEAGEDFFRVMVLWTNDPVYANQTTAASLAALIEGNNNFQNGYATVPLTLQPLLPQTNLQVLMDTVCCVNKETTVGSNGVGAIGVARNCHIRRTISLAGRHTTYDSTNSSTGHTVKGSPLLWVCNTNGNTSTGAYLYGSIRFNYIEG